MLPDLQLAVVAERIRNAEHPIRVLVAEDNPVFQSMLSNMLVCWGYEPVIARDGNEAWNSLQSPNGPQLAILDWMMPGLNGVDVCRAVRAEAREPYVYILLLTARTDTGDLVEGMDSGADDYLTKPFLAQELRVRLRAGRRILELQEQLMAAREALRMQATYDGLTGMMNRTAILDTLQKELSRAQREGSPLSLLMMDLDHFKKVNDTFGHQAGDEVLRETARRMKSAIRAYDAAGRYGGEEFVVVLPGCDESSAYSQAERVRLSIGGAPFDDGLRNIRVTCSLGAASRAHPTEGDSEALLREADAALYGAKNNGRNRVVRAASMALASRTN